MENRFLLKIDVVSLTIFTQSAFERTPSLCKWSFNSFQSGLDFYFPKFEWAENFHDLKDV